MLVQSLAKLVTQMERMVWFIAEMCIIKSHHYKLIVFLFELKRKLIVYLFYIQLHLEVIHPYLTHYDHSDHLMVHENKTL